MKRVHKLRIYPNKTQIKLINDTLGCCNWIKNKYLEINIRRYEKDKSFVSAYDFSKYINHLKKTDPEYYWIKEYSSKAIKDAICMKEKAYKQFFKTKKGFPKFISRKRLNKESYFFIKDTVKYICHNIIKLPVLGKIRITENSYLPEIKTITSGRVIREYNKYYVMFIIDTHKPDISLTDTELGIDLGLKRYATVASNTEVPMGISHFKDMYSYKHIEEKITRLQQIVSHKAEINYGKLLNQYLDKHPGKDISDKIKNIMKGESYKLSHIRCLMRKINNLKAKQRNIRKDFINKLVYSLTARTKPCKITLEDLDISDMIEHNGTKDTKLHKYIAESAFYEFKMRMFYACEKCGITLRLADKYYASSKTCCICGHKKKDLKLRDRIYECEECGNRIDRDLNAAINLLHLKDKKTIVYDFA